MKIKEGLSLKQINEAMSILESTADLVDVAYNQARETGAKSIKNTEAFLSARERVNNACSMLGIEVPPIFRQEDEDKKLYD